MNVTIVTYNVRGKNQKKMMAVHMRRKASMHACYLIFMNALQVRTLISIEIFKGMIYGERDGLMRIIVKAMVDME